jgi:hypothetical protein
MAKIASRGEALRLHQLGWSVSRIARELGVKDDSVRRSLERAGVRLRGPSGQPIRRVVPTREDRAEALAAVLPVLEHFNRLASAVRELAAEYLFDHFSEPAAQELMLAARRAKEDAGDCLFYGRLSFHADETPAAEKPDVEATDLETIRRATRLLAEAGAARNGDMQLQGQAGFGPEGQTD